MVFEEILFLSDRASSDPAPESRNPVCVGHLWAVKGFVGKRVCLNRFEGRILITLRDALLLYLCGVMEPSNSFAVKVFQTLERTHDHEEVTQVKKLDSRNFDLLTLKIKVGKTLRNRVMGARHREMFSVEAKMRLRELTNRKRELWWGPSPAEEMSVEEKRY